MLNATSEIAVRAMVFLALRGEEGPVSPAEIASAVGASPSYMAKIANVLVKGGILRSQRGAWGGVVLARAPATITLLDIVQACQGLLIANYCQALGAATSPDVCSFHQAMFDVHNATVRALSRWNLKMLAAKPEPSGAIKGHSQCRMLRCGRECGDASSRAGNRKRVSAVSGQRKNGRMR